MNEQEKLQNYEQSKTGIDHTYTMSDRIKVRADSDEYMEV